MPGNETDDAEPTGDLACDLVELGGVLDQVANPVSPMGMMRRRLPPDERTACMSRVAALEESLNGAVQTESNAGLRRIMGVRRGECVPPDLLRVLAVVAHRQVVVGTHALGVTSICRCAGMGEAQGTIEARKALRLLIARGAFSFADGDCGDGEIRLCQRAVRLLSGNGLDLIWSAESIRRDMAKGSASQQLQDLQRRAAINKVRDEAAQARVVAKAGGAHQPMSARSIFQALRQEVIGVDPVVRSFAVQAAIHHQRIAIAQAGQRQTTPPVVVLIAGPSGCGKTHLVESFGRCSRLPVGVSNLAECTASGWVGLSLDDMFLSLLRPGVSLADASTGVLVLDEADKRSINNSGTHYDISGRAVQDELLKVVEGHPIQIGGRRSGLETTKGVIETKTMMFVLAGAFQGLSEAAKSLSRSKSGIGFSGSKQGGSSAAGDVRAALAMFFIPELVNRINGVILVPAPSVEQLLQIASAPVHGVLDRQNAFLSSFGLALQPTREALLEVASWALDTKTYARGVRSLLQSVAEEAIFEETKGELRIGVGDVRRAIQATAMTASD